LSLSVDSSSAACAWTKLSARQDLAEDDERLENRRAAAEPAVLLAGRKDHLAAGAEDDPRAPE
jgi:hypothetical protein